MNGHMLCSQGERKQGKQYFIVMTQLLLWDLLKQHEYVLQKLYLLHNTIVQVE